MNLCRNIAVVVAFFLALTLSLSLAVGAVEYPPAIALESVIASSISEYTVYALSYSEELDYRGNADAEFRVPESWRWIPLMFNNSWQEVMLKHCNWNVVGYGEDEEGNHVAYTDYPAILKKGEKYTLEIVWELKLYHDRQLPDFSLEDSGTFDDIPPELVEEYTKAEGVWKNAVLDERIQRTAFSLKDPNVLQTLYNIIAWIGGHIRYWCPDKAQYPEEVYHTRKGECEDTSNLIIALCRILGIPAYLETGFGMDPEWDGEWSGGYLHFSWLNYYPTAWARVYVPNIGWLPVDWVACYRPGGPRTPKGAITQADILKPNFCVYYINIHSDPITVRKDIFLGWNEGMSETRHEQRMYLDVNLTLNHVDPLLGSEGVPWVYQHLPSD